MALAGMRLRGVAARPPQSVPGPNFDVSPGGVLEEFELAVAGMARRQLAAGILGDPSLPDRPPGAGDGSRGGEPFFRRRRVLVVLPMAIFAAGRVDNTGNMT